MGSSFWSGLTLAILLNLIKVIQNEPYGFSQYQVNHYGFTGVPKNNYRVPKFASSNFYSDPDIFYGNSNKEPFFDVMQSAFVGYGPNYFQSLGNSGFTKAPPAQSCRYPPKLPSSCRPSKYRTMDGSCNNEKNPSWGATKTNYGRLIPAKYADGIHQPPISVTGKPLPESRTLSIALFPDVDVKDPKWTLAAMQFGQFITHDMSIAAGTTQAHSHPTKCCSDDGLTVLPGDRCFPIMVPKDDPLNKKFNQRCMNFVRTRTDQSFGCVNAKAAEQMVGVTHWLDGSMVYGADDKTARALRLFNGGLLKVDFRNGKIWPPAQPNRTVCEGQTEEQPCYMTGDLRANQNPQLTIFHIMMLREHNRIANQLAEINPHWNDETLYQEARKIVIGEIQHISYYEWLPIFLGWENLLSHGVIYDAQNAYVNDYNEKINPSVLNEHATAAFRYFHSNIQGYLKLVTDNRYSYGMIRLSDYLNRPHFLEDNNNFDDLARGMTTQAQQAADSFHTAEITDFLFRNGKQFGGDLKARDIQRGRDHGLASYNDYRHFCGLPKANIFEDFYDYIDPQFVEKLKQLYAHPDDVDLTIGGSLERHIPGTLSGPTFLCIMTEQFYRTRVADRFFYEHGNHPAAFTPEQLNEIRKSSMARLMCDNVDDISSMQPRAFEKISHKNLLTNCRSIGAVNLEAWRDGRNRNHGHHHFVTF